MNLSVRLAKRVAEQLGCSRQTAEQYIAGAWVTVDQEIIEEPGFRVEPEQEVALLPGANLDPIAPMTIIFHKPAGIDAKKIRQIISLETQAPGDRSGLRFLKRHTTDLNVTDELEINASGMLVLTQDWHIARKLIEDAARVEQEYIVEVAGDLKPDGLALLQHGLSFNGKPIAPCKVSWQNETRLRFALKGVQRFQIVHMCEAVGLQVVNMKRIRIGRIAMAGLPAGQWRYLLGYERF